MKKLFPLFGLVALTGCQMMPHSSMGTQARASLDAKSGSSVTGQVNLQEAKDKVRVTAKVSGLKPNSEHGFHVHEKGDCSAADATSAGGHFNPEGQPHGHYGHAKRHAGDMPNLVANDKGDASVSFDMEGVRLDDGKHGILNRAIVVHANPDDYQSQPAGNAGCRRCCGRQPCISVPGTHSTASKKVSDKPRIVECGFQTPRLESRSPGRIVAVPNGASLIHCMLMQATLSIPTIVQRGTEPYSESFSAMRRFTDLRTPDTPDEMWLVEHPPVFTLGLGADSSHVLDPHSIPVVQTDRGGEVTYHGPGQAVVYLLMDLRRRPEGRLLAREFVRRMEQAVIDTLAAYNLAGERKPGAPGIYVATGPRQGAKIAALGLKIRGNGCTYHGLALNVAMDLKPFSWINPCGYPGLQTIDMKTLGIATSMQEVRAALADQLIHHLKG
jgi:lipoyl(octanoyl) transferase